MIQSPSKPLPPLREYQIALVKKIESEIAKGNRKIMLQLPTGAGKTRCFIELASRHKKNPYLDGHQNCLIIAHRKELVGQAKEGLLREFRSKLPTVGEIRAKVTPNPGCPIQVASIKTLVKRKLPIAGLVIIDEAHHAMASSYKYVIEEYPNAVLIGVTATPARTDGSGFQDCFDVLIKGASIKELTRDGYLCPYRLYAYPESKIDVSNISMLAGDYDPDELADAVNIVRADIVSTWKLHAEHQRTVLFAVNIRLSKEYCELFRRAGYAAEHVDSATRDDERTRILNRFRNGTTEILCNVDIVSEGFDLPEIECVQVVRPTRSLVRWMQMVGRSLRPSHETNKECAIILDHTDNYQRLGLPDEDRDWKLNGIEPPTKIPKKHSNDIKRVRNIVHLEGNLIEIHDSNNDSLRTTIMSTCELSERHRKGERNFTGVDLTNSDLRMISLHNINLSNSNLRGVRLSRSSSFKGANLSGVDLSYSDLNGADLNSANLNGANLEAAILTGTNFSKADLRGANLMGAILTRTNFSNADLRGANLMGAKLAYSMTAGRQKVKSAGRQKVNLSTNLCGARLSRAIMPDGSLHQ